jgi:hypothetical protein
MRVWVYQKWFSWFSGIVDNSVLFLVELFTMMVLRTEESYYEFVGTRAFLCWYIEQFPSTSLTHAHDDTHPPVKSLAIRD